MWIKDRTEPASFAISNDYITFETDPTGPTTAFYRYQGRQSAVTMDFKVAWTMTTELTIEPSDLTSNVNKSVWTYAQIEGGDANYAIIGVINEGAGLKWQWYDTDGSWKELGSIATTPGKYTIVISWSAGQITQSVNNAPVNTYALGTSGDKSKPTAILLEAQNYGAKYASTWKYPVVTY